MKLMYYMVPHVCALYRECGEYRPDSDMFQDLRVVFLHGFSMNSLLSTFGIYLLHERIYCHFFSLLQHWDLMIQLVILRLVT